MQTDGALNVVSKIRGKSLNYFRKGTEPFSLCACLACDQEAPNVVLKRGMKDKGRNNFLHCSEQIVSPTFRHHRYDKVKAYKNV